MKTKSSYLSDFHHLFLVIYFNQKNKEMARKYYEMCKKENVEIPPDIESGMK